MLLSAVEAQLVAHVMSTLDSIDAKVLVTVRDTDVVDNPSGSVLIINHESSQFETYPSRRAFYSAYAI